jgi:hypothetical protein
LNWNNEIKIKIMKINMRSYIFSLFGFVILTSGCSQTEGFPSFQTHKIDSVGSHMGQTDLADLDNDGDLDWVVGEAPWSKTSRLWWWEYKNPDEWVRHEIGKAKSDVGGACADVNGDNWIDFWGGSMLYLNNQDGSFSQHDVGTIFSHDSQFGDVDRDGKLDGIANSDKYGLVWYEIPEDPTIPWKEHMIQPITSHKIHAGASPVPLGDLDGDGDNDIVTGMAWYENIDGVGIEWKEHKNIELGEIHKYGIGVKTWVTDLDQDGDNDIIQSEADNPDSRVAWFENDGRGNWIRHMIKKKGELQDFHSLVVADFDNDGDLDVCSGGGPLSGAKMKIYLWENTAQKGKTPTTSNWIEHILAEVPCHEMVAGDVDGDGDVDICTKPWTTGNTHYYIENLLK